MRFLVILGIALFTTDAKTTTYKGCKVFRLNLTTEEDARIIESLTRSNDFDVWSCTGYTEKRVDIMVHPRAQTEFTDMLKTKNITHNVLINDVEKATQTVQKLNRQLENLQTLTFQKFYSYLEVNSYLSNLAQQYPDVVQVRTIGTSFEGREIKVVQISKNGVFNNPIVLIEAGIHGREWIAPAMALYIINQIVEEKQHRDLIDKVDWHIVPVLNPDGYDYSLRENPLWTKTRSKRKNKRCIGVDANRNFDFQWGIAGATFDHCSELYRGIRPFCEAETKNFSVYVHRLNSNIKLFLSLQSYGNLILYPWGHVSLVPKNQKELKELAETVKRFTIKNGGPHYLTGSIANVIMPCSGISTDWAMAVEGIKLSYRIALPDGGKTGFHPRSEEILPMLRGSFPAFVSFGRYITKKFGKLSNDHDSPQLPWSLVRKHLMKK